MSFNPFDLRGPDFLSFFLCFSIALIIILNELRKRSESDQSTTFDLAQDPYQIAYLRGGKRHLIQSAAFSLLDRKLLKTRDAKLRTIHGNSIESARSPLERAILKRFRKEDNAKALFADPDILVWAEDIGDALRSKNLIPSEKQRSRRLILSCFGLLLLWGMAGTKIYVALSRGKTNILFLIILSFVFSYILWKVINKLRTYAGDNEFKRLKKMFSRLYHGRMRLRPHTATDQLVLLTALFGLSSLPPTASAMITALHLRPISDSGYQWGGCGASTGGSWGGGSSCGGGACGGGCGGGCGGCGGS